MGLFSKLPRGTASPAILGASPWIVLVVGFGVSLLYRSSAINLEVMSPRTFTQLASLYTAILVALLAGIVLGAWALLRGRTYWLAVSALSCAAYVAVALLAANLIRYFR